MWGALLWHGSMALQRALTVSCYLQALVCRAMPAHAGSTRGAAQAEWPPQNCSSSARLSNSTSSCENTHVYTTWEQASLLLYT